MVDFCYGLDGAGYGKFFVEKSFREGVNFLLCVRVTSMVDEAVLSFSPRSDSGYEVCFDGINIGTFEVPKELRVAREWEFSELENLGGKLGEALFSSCPKLVESIRGLSGPVRFVLEFDKGTEGLLNLPWEFLRHPDSGSPLSLEFPFVRRIGKGVKLEPLGGRPLKVLVVICEPLNLDLFGGRGFHDVICEESKDLVEKGLLQLEFLSLPSTPDEFGRRVLRDCPDVIHFIGHGNVGILAFEDEGGGMVDVDAKKFYAFFKRREKPRLVILTACFSGAVGGRDLVSGTATALVEAGVPSVLAMQLPIGVESAYRLVGDLYASLLDRPFDEIVRDLRASRFFAERLHAPAQWGIPVFYLQGKNGRLLEGVSVGESFLKGWSPSSSDYWLPPEPELFVGRREDLVRVSKALCRSRVVVVEGLSGMGKSFLARKICHWYRLRGSFPGGIVWIDLQAGGSYEGALERIGSAFGVPKEFIEGRLGSMSTLLVLDSYEQAKEDPKLAKFLVSLPKSAQAILTSRERVGFGERVRVGEMKPKDAAEYFYRRALKAGWNGETGEEDISKICEKLGGMPLCIELVAPKAGKFPIVSLLEMVEETLKTIAEEREDLPERLQSIEAALRVSYDPLKPMEKWLLAVMSVFPGNVFHQILGEIAELPESNALSILGNLQDNGLVDFDGTSYRLHLMVRRFALERLEKDFKEREKYEERFAKAFLGIAHWGKEAIKKGEEARTAVNMALLELPNLLRAEEWFFEKKRLDECLTVSNALDFLFDGAGLWQSRIETANIVIKAAEQKGKKEVLSTVLNNLSVAYTSVGEMDLALKCCKRALKIAEEIDSKERMANALGNIGIVLSQIGKLDEALKQHQKALDIDKEIGNKLGMAQDYANIGIVLSQIGKLDEALKQHQKALDIDKEIGNKLGMANQLGNIGLIFMDIGKPEEALKQHQKALDIDKEIGNKLGMAQDYGNIGIVLIDIGKSEEALKHLQDSLKIHKEIGNKLGMANQLGNIGILIADIDPQKALDILKTALNIFKQIGAVTEAEKTKKAIDIIEKKQQTNRKGNV